jgi:hypothetical protein
MGAHFMWIMKEKYDYWLWKDWLGWLKLCFLTEIGRFHWNHGEKLPTSPVLVSPVGSH